MHMSILENSERQSIIQRVFTVLLCFAPTNQPIQVQVHAEHSDHFDWQVLQVSNGNRRNPV